MSYFRLMENLIIRDATLADLPILLQFEQELIMAERPFDVTIKEDPVSYYDIEAYILNEEVKVVIAVYNNQIISSGYALKKEARHYLNHKYYGYLGFMYTVEEYRGMGINKKIVDVLKNWCLDNGLKEIRLTVYQNNQPALKAYAKTGFRPHILEMRLDI
ncbi:hypothetical protein MTsPCn9_35300 [Croceitalea sp. MTPC9]|uniref:GNAT family N-acetyltransferase n=1 Tax=unclassified Croceitalea TaxID=2632280 RepID=UPI002B37E27C|nr:hypothetical protein MTsPCn6_17930 [Croceitalea sp. MTPC6]GMN18590.1 hypothetical protein MTsPCn9_35300 [Croceitalea sp. MTPC9]